MYLNPFLYCKLIMGRGKLDLPYISCTKQCMEQNRTQKVIIQLELTLNPEPSDQLEPRGQL